MDVWPKMHLNVFPILNSTLTLNSNANSTLTLIVTLTLALNSNFNPKSNAAFTLSGFDDQERNLMFVKTAFPV